jgi:hypothetical protein
MTSLFSAESPVSIEGIHAAPDELSQRFRAKLYARFRYT